MILNEQKKPPASISSISFIIPKAMKVEARELSEQIKMRMEMGVTEIPDELIQKAEIIVHQVSVGFRNHG